MSTLQARNQGPPGPLHSNISALRPPQGAVPGPRTSQDYLILKPMRSLRGEDSAQALPSDMRNSKCQVSQITSEVLLGNRTEAAPSCHAHPRLLLHIEGPERRSCIQAMQKEGAAMLQADSSEN